MMDWERRKAKRRTKNLKEARKRRRRRERELRSQIEFNGQWSKVRLTLTRDDIFSGHGVSAFSREGYGLVLRGDVW